MRVTSRRRPPRSLGQSALVPAASRLPESLTPEEQSLNAQAIETFTAAVGGRQQLADVLSVADGGADTDRVVRLLCDPRFERLTLRALCQHAGLTVADLFRSYKKALIVRAHLEATSIIAAKLPPIVDDVMTRATPMPVVCPTCENDPARRTTCTTCRTIGVIRSEPDLDRQKLALELGHLTEKRGGLTIQQQQHVVASAQALSAPQAGALEQLQQAVGDLLFNPGRRRAMSPRETPIGDPEPFPVPGPTDPEPVPDPEPDEPDPPISA